MKNQISQLCLLPIFLPFRLTQSKEQVAEMRKSNSLKLLGLNSYLFVKTLKALVLLYFSFSSLLLNHMWFWGVYKSLIFKSIPERKKKVFFRIGAGQKL